MSTYQMNPYELIFAYGTLRPPRVDTAVLDSKFHAEIAPYLVRHVAAQVQNAQLYDLGAYPAAMPGNGLLHGDLLTVEPVALPIMDRIEGHPTFYQRKRVAVLTDEGQVEAWIYWAPVGILLGRRQIESGDWFERPAVVSDTLNAQEPPFQETAPVDETLHALIKRFAEAECSWLSTVRPDLRPQSSPIWHVWYRGRAYVVTTPGAIKTANIEHNPRVTIAHPDPKDALIIDGWAIEAPAMRHALQPLFQAKYNWDISTDAAYGTVLEITPTKLMAWGQYGEGRWSGEELLKVW